MNKPFRPSGQLTISAKDFGRYAGYQAIPLHKPDAVRTIRDKKTGKTKTVRIAKRPLDFNWTTRAYKTAEVIKRCVADQRNMGIRLRSTDLVLDMDLRHGGEEGLEDLCMDAGLDLSKYPRVVTGSGGLHIYGKKPADLLVVDTLPAFAGVEFKSKGRQVVAAGSVHPDTGKLYKFDDDFPPLDDAPEWPETLFDLIRRPERSGEAVGGGQYTQEQLAKALDKLDPEDFRDHDEWLRLMMACHAATNGDARPEFVEWSTSDPNYSDDAEIIGRRWDSLHSEKPDGITYRTLNAILADHGASNETVAGDAAADFEGSPIDPEQEAGVDEEPSEDAWLDGDTEEARERKSWLQELNNEFCGVYANGRWRIMSLEMSDSGQSWTAAGKEDFMSFQQNRMVVNPNDPNKIMKLGQAWMEWPGRKTARGTTFDTNAEAGTIVGNALNLWQGFAVKPKQGSWKLFEKLIFEDICDGDMAVFEYVLRWCAWKFQNPGELPQVAIAMKGKKGTGKTTFGEAIQNIFGKHGMCIADMEKIAGRFNGHLEFICYIYSDEAFWAGDVQSESKIKKLITDRPASYEHKGIPTFTGINHVGLVFGSNEEWMVPVTENERRYCVTRTSDRHIAPEGEPNHPNRAYWSAVHAELANGGLAAFLFDMLAMKVEKHPREDVPLTEELARQKVQGFKGITAWYFERLQEADMTETAEGVDTKWAGNDLHVNPTELWKAYRDWQHAINPRAIVTRKALIKELKAFGWDAGEHCREKTLDRSRYWLCPSLDRARAVFDSRMKGKFFDDDEAG